MEERKIPRSWRKEGWASQPKCTMALPEWGEKHTPRNGRTREESKEGVCSHILHVHWGWGWPKARGSRSYTWRVKHSSMCAPGGGGTRLSRCPSEQHTGDENSGSLTPPFPQTEALAPQRCSVKVAASSLLSLAANQRLCLGLRGAKSRSSQPLFPGEAKVCGMHGGLLSPLLRLHRKLACILSMGYHM